MKRGGIGGPVNVFSSSPCLISDIVSSGYFSLILCLLFGFLGQLVSLFYIFP